MESKWIPVSDRLPEEGVDVVVFSPGNVDGEFHVCSWCVERNGRAEPFSYFSRNDMKCIWDVTHWMPLPEPPTE
jgi:hypothetical protein